MWINKVRKFLAQYNELFFIIYLLPLNICTASGLTSESKIYQVFFGIGLLFLLLKLVCTDYSIREIIWMIVITALLGIVFIRNREKTLILTALSIYGCKGISVRRIIQYMLVPRVLFTVLTVGLAYFNIIPNQEVLLPKNGEWYTLYCYGYYQPNILFVNLFIIFLLFMGTLRQKMRAYMYVCWGIVLFAAYKIVLSRTGWYLYLIFCLMILVYWLLKKRGWEKKYLSLFATLPIVMTVLSFLLIILYSSEVSVIKQLDYILTGRIGLMSQAINGLALAWMGNIPRLAFDNSYMHIYYNYGIFLLVIAIVSYSKTIFLLCKKRWDYEVLILGIIAIYGFMEQFPLNATWNVFILYVSSVLFSDMEEA